MDLSIPTELLMMKESVRTFVDRELVPLERAGPG